MFQYACGNMDACWLHGGATSTGYQHGWYYSVPELNVHYMIFFFTLFKVKTIDLEKEIVNILQILIVYLNFLL